MTIREHLVACLYAKGLFEDEAKQVLSLLEAKPSSEPMTGRWKDAVGDCPAALIRVLEISAAAAALEWIDANVPLHWARPMFDPKSKLFK